MTGLRSLVRASARGTCIPRVAYVSTASHSNFTLHTSLLTSIKRSPAALSLIHSLLVYFGKSIHMSSSPYKEIGYEDFLELKKTGLTIIDVRGSDELKASGSIPGSLNIPSSEIESALKKNSDEFMSSYGKSKPSENDQIMFYCQRGVRSRKAMEKAIQMGYKNATSFKGGWEEFSKSATTTK